MNAVVRNPDLKVSTNSNIERKNTHIPMLDTGSARYRMIIFNIPKTDMIPFPASDRKCLFFNFCKSWNAIELLEQQVSLDLEEATQIWKIFNQIFCTARIIPTEYLTNLLEDNQHVLIELILQIFARPDLCFIFPP